MAVKIYDDRKLLHYNFFQKNDGIYLLHYKFVQKNDGMDTQADIGGMDLG